MPEASERKEAAELAELFNRERQDGGATTRDLVVLAGDGRHARLATHVAQPPRALGAACDVDEEPLPGPDAGHHARWSMVLSWAAPFWTTYSSSTPRWMSATAPVRSR